MLATSLNMTKAALAAFALFAATLPARADSSAVAAECLAQLEEISAVAVEDATAIADRGVHTIAELRERGAPEDVVFRVGRSFQRGIAERGGLALVEIGRRADACLAVMERTGARPETIQRFRRAVEELVGITAALTFEQALRLELMMHG
jgi:hypothetical protein